MQHLIKTQLPDFTQAAEESKPGKISAAKGSSSRDKADRAPEGNSGQLEHSVSSSSSTSWSRWPYQASWRPGGSMDGGGGGNCSAGLRDNSEDSSEQPQRTCSIGTQIAWAASRHSQRATPAGTAAAATPAWSKQDSSGQS